MKTKYILLSVLLLASLSSVAQEAAVEISDAAAVQKAIDQVADDMSRRVQFSPRLNAIANGLLKSRGGNTLKGKSAEEIQQIRDNCNVPQDEETWGVFSKNKEWYEAVATDKALYLRTKQKIDSVRTAESSFQLQEILSADENPFQPEGVFRIPYFALIALKFSYTVQDSRFATSVPPGPAFFKIGDASFFHSSTVVRTGERSIYWFVTEYVRLMQHLIPLYKRDALSDKDALQPIDGLAGFEGLPWGASTEMVQTRFRPDLLLGFSQFSVSAVHDFVNDKPSFPRNSAQYAKYGGQSPQRHYERYFTKVFDYPVFVPLGIMEYIDPIFGKHHLYFFDDQLFGVQQQMMPSYSYANNNFQFTSPLKTQPHAYIQGLYSKYGQPIALVRGDRDLMLRWEDSDGFLYLMFKTEASNSGVRSQFPSLGKPIATSPVAKMTVRSVGITTNDLMAGTSVEFKHSGSGPKTFLYSSFPSGFRVSAAGGQLVIVGVVLDEHVEVVARQFQRYKEIKELITLEDISGNKFNPVRSIYSPIKDVGNVTFIFRVPLNVEELAVSCLGKNISLKTGDNHLFSGGPEFSALEKLPLEIRSITYLSKKHKSLINSKIEQHQKGDTQMDKDQQKAERELLGL